MRVCIFTADLGTIAARHESLLQQARALTGHADVELSFVGFRQTQSLNKDIRTAVPHVAADAYTASRVTNAVLRLAEAPIMSRSIARLVLPAAAPSFVEAIVASDCDAVMLDVSWGPYLKPFVDAAFNGPVVLAGSPSAGPAAAKWFAVDPSIKVSIVLPTHNGVRYLRQSIQSCLDQTYRNIELVIVDDGSKLDMRSIVEEFSDKRVRFIRHQQNKGLPAALNTGFRAATGAHLTWTSDDNYYEPTAIERLTRFLQRYPDLGFVYSSMFIVDEGHENAPPRIRRALPPVEVARQNVIGACFMYPRRVYEAIGEYDASAVLVEDYDYWLRISKQFRMQRLLEPLYWYRYHGESLTSKHTVEDVARRFDVVRQQNGVSVTR